LNDEAQGVKYTALQGWVSSPAVPLAMRVSLRGAQRRSNLGVGAYAGLLRRPRLLAM